VAAELDIAFNRGAATLLAGAGRYSVLGDTGALAGTSVYNTSFPLTENPISESGAWIAGTISPPRTNVQSDGVHAFATMVSFDGTNFNDSVAILNGTWPANQWVQGTVYNQSALSGQECELVLHGTLTALTNTGLEIDCVLVTGHIDLVAWLGPPNSFSTLASATGITFNDGDVIYAQIVGTVVTIKKNGATVLTHDTAGDSLPFSSGAPGQGHWNQTGSAANCTKLGWKNWQAGAL